MRLIDADETIDAINSYIHRCHGIDKDFLEGLQTAKDIISHISTVDEGSRLICEDEIIKRAKDVYLAEGCKHRCFDITELSEIPTVYVKRKEE